MPLVCLGLSHHTAPVEVRERHAFPASRMSEALVALRDYEAVQEAVMLQTCGRLEIYAEIDDYEAGSTQLRSFLQHYRHAAVPYDLNSYMYTLLGREAAEHLMRVSAGLDTMLIGEAEILAQVKQAHVEAQLAQSLGPVLHKLFRDSLSAGKAARSQTHIGDESPSGATAAIEIAKRHFKSLAGRVVAIVGAGKMGRIATKRFRSEGVAELILINRTVERAREVIADLGFGKVEELAGLDEAIAAADLVLTSTGGSDFVLRPDNVGAAMALRPNRELIVIDLAVPRDSDPRIAEIPNVRLIDIDDVKSHVDNKLSVRREAIPHVEEIVAEYADRFNAWYQSRGSEPVIASLTQKADAIREAELERLFARCPELDERERMLIAGASMKIISRLLHTVIVNVREKADGDRSHVLERARLLEELFELGNVDAPR